MVTNSNGRVSVGDKPIEFEEFFTAIVTDFGVLMMAGRGGFNGAGETMAVIVWCTAFGSGTFNVLPY